MTWDILNRLIAASVDLSVLAVLTWGGLRLLRPRSPRLIAVLWLLVMVRPLIGLAVGPLVPLDLPRVSIGSPAGQVQHEREEILTRGGAVRSERVSRLAGPSTASTSMTIPDGAATLWAAGMAVLLLVALVDRLRLRRLLRESEPAPANIRERMEEAARDLGVPAGRRLPDLLVTRTLESPALAGLWRPVVLVPSWLTGEERQDQLRWALSHELTHWRAGDLLAGAVRQIFQTVFFFHPVAWWVGRQWEESTELACDRALVSTQEEAASYAERLYEILIQARGRRRPAVAGGLFATRTQIGRRIAALLHEPVAGPVRLSTRTAIALSLLTLLSLAVGAGCSHDPSPMTADLKLTGRDGRFSLEAYGRFALTRDHDDIEALTPGSRMILEETSGETIRMEITAAPDGKVLHAFTVGGKTRPYDREGRAWMAKALPLFSTFLGPRRDVRLVRLARPFTRTWRRLENRASRLLS
jgi:beta-lactamase regulating signal transducer with metallopeptidase domain